MRRNVKRRIGSSVFLYVAHSHCVSKARYLWRYGNNDNLVRLYRSRFAWRRGIILTKNWLEVTTINKNAFQWDAYHPLVDRISPALCRGVSARGVSARGGVCPRGVCSGGGVCSGVYSSMQWSRHPPPCGQTDTCENITFANFILRAITINILV